MAEVTAQMIKELRERTQAGMSDCKSALIEAGGEMEAAVELILKKGLAKQAKKASAAATEGEVRAFVPADGSFGVIVEINSQTDFVAKNDGFKQFVDNVITLAQSTKAGEDLLAKTYPGSTKSLEEIRKEFSGTIGENIQVRRWARFDVEGAGFVHSYVHMGGKIGVLIEIGLSSADLAKNDKVRSFADDTAMQAAAMSAQYLNRAEISDEAVAKQVEIFKAQLAEEGKPEAAWAKIIEGKKAKWYTEVCLVDQESVISSGNSIDKLRAELSKEVGGEVTIKRFARFERGEGIDKKTDDFAAEVAKMAGNLEPAIEAARMHPKLCAVSVDLDELHHYFAIHGLSAPSEAATAVYDVAIPRMLAWARSMGLPLTLFAVGADLKRAESAARLRAAWAEGHEIGNHTLDHRYDLVRLSREAMLAQVEQGASLIALTTGERPRGFRAPGYTVSDTLFEVLSSLDVTYDASVFPCPPYMLAKLAAISLIALRGRQSRSIKGDPRVLLAPTAPYRIGRPYFREGAGLVEVPVQVTPGLRLPFIGTTLTMAPASIAEAMGRACAHLPSVNLELHGIDFLDERDGLMALRQHQADVRVPWVSKRSKIEAALGALREHGFAFVTMHELASRVA